MGDRKGNCLRAQDTQSPCSLCLHSHESKGCSLLSQRPGSPSSFPKGLFQPPSVLLPANAPVFAQDIFPNTSPEERFKDSRGKHS